MLGVRRAFTLMELMIIIVIIGIVYAMALSSFKIPDPKKLESFSMLDLPEYLRKNYPLTDTKLVCFEPCGSCKVLVDGEWMEDEIELFDSSDVRAYTLDVKGYASQKVFAPHDMNDAYKEACFILHKRVNDAIEPIVLEANKQFIYYQAGYEKAKVYTSLSQIENEYTQTLERIRNER